MLVPFLLVDWLTEGRHGQGKGDGSGDSDTSDGLSDISEGGDSGEGGEEEEMVELMAQMDRELAGTEVGKSFQKMKVCGSTCLLAMDGLHPLSSVYHSYPRSKFKREGKRRERERRERRERESCNQLTLTSTWFRTCWSLMTRREGRLALPPTSYTLWGCGYQSRGRNTHKIKDSTHQTLNLNQHSLIHNFIRIENCQIIALLFLINFCSD